MLFQKVAVDGQVLPLACGFCFFVVVVIYFFIFFSNTPWYCWCHLASFFSVGGVFEVSQSCYIAIMSELAAVS